MPVVTEAATGLSRRATLNEEAALKSLVEAALDSYSNDASLAIESAIASWIGGSQTWRFGTPWHRTYWKRKGHVTRQWPR